MIQVDEQGQNCIILYAGTNHCVTKAYLDELLKDASAGDFIAKPPINIRQWQRKKLFAYW